MSQDIEDTIKPVPDLSGDQYRPKKQSEWLPLIINACIFGVYSIIILGEAINDSNAVFNYAILIFLQTFCNFLAFIVFLFSNIKKAGIFLLSGIMVITIGYSVCGGIGNLSSMRVEKEMMKQRKHDSIEAIKCKADSLKQLKELDSTMKLKKDSVK